MYSAKPFNAAPGTNRAEHFLSIVNNRTGGTAAGSTQNAGQGQMEDQAQDTVDGHGKGMSMNITQIVLADRFFCTGYPLDEAMQEEEEEPEQDNAGHDVEVTGGLQGQQDVGPSASEDLPVDPANFMSIDGQTDFGDQGSALQVSC